MIAYNDCEYSLFISYAHDDDKSQFGWVHALRDAISKRLSSLDNEIPKRGVHLSQDNGPSSGTLGAELRERVAKSFGMLLVIGKKYVSSDYCEKELKFFRESFGAAGMESRLYIVVISEDAFIKAQQGEQWKKLMPTDQIWVPMFEENDHNKPLSPTMNDGTSGYPALFVNQVSKIADRLIKEIEKDHARSKKMIQLPDKSGLTDIGVNLSSYAGTGKQVVIGPHTSSLDSKVDIIKELLGKAGADVTVLDRDAIDNYNPEDGSPLRQLLAKADVLVVPMTLEWPLQQLGYDGGHTTILKNEWAAVGKKERDLVWFRPPDVVVEAGKMASEKHLKILEQLVPVCFSETALMNYLFGIGSDTAIRVLIEYHAETHAFKRLARLLENAWNSLPPDSTRPMLRCAQLDLSDLDHAPKDAAGVVLLLPINGELVLKSPGSLLAQINEVQRVITYKNTTYPGIVVILYKPPLVSKIPRHEWSYVQIKESEQEPELSIEDDTKPELEEFLTDLWKQYRINTSAASSAVDMVGRMSKP